MSKEERIESMLRGIVFSNVKQKAELKDILRSNPGELTEEELECVAGGVYAEDFVLLSDEDFDKWKL